jgi:glucosylceramidase
MKSGPYKTPANVPSAFDGGTMKSDEAILRAYAQYFVKFVEGYRKEGIKIEAVAPQNEPNYDQNYPSCLWKPATFTTFVGKYLGPALKGKGVKIMLGTLSNADVQPERKDIDILTSVMADATARPYIKFIGLQYDMLSHAPVARMIQSLTAFNVSFWQSEHMCGNYPWIAKTYKPTPANDHAYAVESWGLIRDWIRAGATSYSAWNMVLDTVGKGIDTTRDWAQNALLTVDTGANKLNVTPAYYVFRHVSQFVDPGAKVLGTSGSRDALAFKNSDSTVVVLYNADAAAKKMIVAIGSRKLQVEVPANGWATINWKN